METTEAPHQSEQTPVDLLTEKAEELVGAQYEGDKIARENAVKEKRRTLEQAYSFLFGNDGNANAETVQLESLQQSDWDKLEELSSLVAGINQMKWYLDHGKRFYKCKRDDGSITSVPRVWFGEDSHHLRLREIDVNHAGGYTLFDVLRAIVDPTTSKERKLVKELYGDS